MFRSRTQSAQCLFGSFFILAILAAGSPVLAQSSPAPTSLTLSKGEWTCLFQRLDIYLENKVDPVYVVHNATCTNGMAGETPPDPFDGFKVKPGNLFKKGGHGGNDVTSMTGGTSRDPPYVTIAPETIDPNDLAPVLASEGFDVPSTVTKRWSDSPYKPNSGTANGKMLVSVLSKKQLTCIKQKQVAIVANNADPRTFDFAECDK